MSDDDAREGWTLDQLLARTVALRLLQREIRGQEVVEEETRTLRRLRLGRPPIHGRYSVSKRWLQRPET